MKHWCPKKISRALIFVFVIMAGVVSGQSREVEFGSIEMRDGARYLVGEQIPFSGVAVSRYPNGDIALKSAFRDGIQHGLETGWYQSGRLKHEIIYRSGQPQTLGSKWYEDKPAERDDLLLCSETEQLGGFCEKEETGEGSRFEPCIDGEKCDESELEPERSSTFEFCTDEEC